MSLFGGTANPYDDIVANATDENLTSENWEIILNLCDKVSEEGPNGARNVIAAVLKRLTHRNPNVQLYSLALSESLSKNCGKELHSEIASRAFTQGLERLVTDRTTHDKVRRKALQLVAMWASDWENDPTLGIIEECYNSLKAKNYSFDVASEPPPPDVDDEVRRREEEELQRALEISMTDKGGRQQWAQYSLTSSNPGASGSSSTAAGSSGTASSAVTQPEPSRHYSGGYAPSPNAQTEQAAPAYTQPTSSTIPVAASTQTSAPTTPAAITGPVTRVRALHTFEPTEPGELAFERGDIIKVVDRGYKDWWRGQLKGRTGIFPVNYVEALPEPTPAELAAEAQAEANVFSQAANIDRLLAMLRQIDPAKDSLADNEEIQELYRSSVALRPKIVKLIDKYSQKRADLVAMNENFLKARTVFDRMMEESLARHSGYYEQRPPYSQTPVPYPTQSDPRAAYGQDPQTLGWNPAVYDQPGYNAYPAPAAGYTTQPDGHVAAPQLQQQPSYTAQRPQSVIYTQPYPYGAQQEAQSQSAQPQPQPQPQVQQQPAQAQAQAQPEQAQPPQQHQQPQVQVQESMQGPPYVFDPNATYPDPNAQAWAQYYAHGGDDPTGAVYFISVPGIKPAGGSPPLSSGAAQASQVSLTSSQGSLYDQQQQAQQPGSPTSPSQPASVGQQNAYLTAQPGAALQRQDSIALPNPYGSNDSAPTPYGQSPYPPAQDANAQYASLPAQFASMQVGEHHQGVPTAAPAA